MSQKEEFTEPKTINVREELAKLNDKIDKLMPAAQPTALTESTSPPPEDYRIKVLEMLKDPNTNMSWNPASFKPEDTTKERKLFETIGAVTAGSAVPEIWAKDVFRCCPYPASAFLGAPFIKWHEDLQGQPGDTLHVVTVGTILCGTAGCAEPASSAPTVSALAITLEEYQCSFYLCRNDMEDMLPDAISELNEALATCIDHCIDNAFIANLKDKGQGTLALGNGTVTAAYIAQLMGSMRAGTCEPVALIIHPVVEASLMQDSQFVNAATFGDRSVITGGHIINYLGLDIVVIPKGSLVYTAGSYDSLLLSRYAVHAAMKRPPNIESQYLVQTQRKYVYASVRFGKRLICQAGLWHMISAA